MNRLPLNILLLRIIACLLLLSISRTTLAQQWQLGHQPSQYSVPQYNPNRAGSYPLRKESSASVEPLGQDDFLPALDAPRSIPDPTLSYPLSGNRPQTSHSIDQLPAPNLIPMQEPRAREIPQETDINLMPVAPPHSIPLMPSQPTSPAIESTPQTGSQPGRFALDYSIYRDFNTYPIDPRKPCNECIRPQIEEACSCRWPGKQGRPFQDLEPGACRCSSASNKNRPNFSYNWPAPFSAIREAHHAGSSNGARRKRINDHFDHLVDFKLINYKRTDNGYCGPGSDPYGCLGESRVAGVGFRQPGESAVQIR